MSRKIKFGLLALGLGVSTMAAFYSVTKQSAVLEGRNPASSFVDSTLPGESLHFSPRAGEQYVYQFSRQISFQGLSNTIPEIKYHGELSFDVFHVG